MSQAQNILSHFDDVADAEYSLKLIQSISRSNSVNPAEFYIGVGYQDSDIKKTQIYYEIINGVIVRKYYESGRFERIRTPHKLNAIQSETHLGFFNMVDLEAAINSAK